MFQRILVPLDGSARAEQAISVAARIARASGGSIILLQVSTAAIDFAWTAMESPSMLQGTLDADCDRADEYLTNMARSHELEGIKTTIVVLQGVPAEAILEEAHSQAADLIVICSHGNTGLKRWVLGSVAQKVARYSPAPVLVLHEHAGVLTNMHPQGTRAVRILVALDGSPLAEVALEPAAYLSAALSAPQPGALHLTQVLHLPTNYEYGQNDSLARVKQQRMVNADAYLHTMERRLCEGDLGRLNLQVTSSVADDLDIAATLIRMAENGEHMDEVAGCYGCDMVTMATHGRNGLQRWILGSVTERMLEATRLPLLIVRPQKNAIKAEKTRETPETAGELPTFVGLF